MPKKVKNPADYIQPLNINGLQGRMLRMPPPQGHKRELMFVYGHHSSLERWFGVAEQLNKYGSVTVPDLPGFGGMQPFYKIGEKPTLDNMADYLATFIKLRYRGRRFSLTGLSLGFMVITRMLQKYPEIAKKIDMLVSFVGFAHQDDFRFKRWHFLLFRYGSSFFSTRLPAAFMRHVLFTGPLIRLGYKILEPIFVPDEHSKVRDTSKENYKKRIDFEISLWQSNDVRTYMSMGVTMFKLDLTGKHVDLPVYHVALDNDRYFNNLSVEQHMRTIYSDFILVPAKVPAHAPSIIATAKDAAPFIPHQLRELLKQKG